MKAVTVLALLSLAAVALAATEYQLELSLPQHGAQHVQRLLSLGVLLDKPRRNATKVTGFATAAVINTLEAQKIAFRRVPHEGRAARARALRSRDRAIAYHHHADLLAFVDSKVAAYPNLCKKVRCFLWLPRAPLRRSLCVAARLVACPVSGPRGSVFCSLFALFVAPDRHITGCHWPVVQR